MPSRRCRIWAPLCPDTQFASKVRDQLDLGYRDSLRRSGERPSLKATLEAISFEAGILRLLTKLLDANWAWAPCWWTASNTQTPKPSGTFLRLSNKHVSLLAGCTDEANPTAFSRACLQAVLGINFILQKHRVAHPLQPIFAHATGIIEEAGRWFTDALYVQC